MSTIILLISSFIAIVSAFISWWQNQYDYWKNLNVPHVKGKIPLGSLHYKGQCFNLAELTQTYYNQMKKCTNDFLGFFFIHKPSILVTNLDFVKQILVKDFEYFQSHGTYYNEKDDPLSAHLFHLEGEKWKLLREKITPTFTTAKIKQMFSIVLNISQRFVDVLSTGPAEKIEMKDLFARFFTDIIGNCAFGLDVNSLNEPNTKFREMGKLETEYPRHNKYVSTFMLTYPSIARFLGIKSVRDDTSKYFKSILEAVMTQREQNPVDRQDFLALLLKLKNEENKITFDELAAQCLIFFEAGFETLSVLMEFTLIELAKNEELQTKVRDSIEEGLHKNDGNLTYESIKDMKYLDYCIKGRFCFNFFFIKFTIHSFIFQNP